VKKTERVIQEKENARVERVGAQISQEKKVGTVAKEPMDLALPGRETLPKRVRGKQEIIPIQREARKNEKWIAWERGKTSTEKKMLEPAKEKKEREQCAKKGSTAVDGEHRISQTDESPCTAGGADLGDKIRGDAKKVIGAEVIKLINIRSKASPEKGHRRSLNEVGQGHKRGPS